MEVVDVDLSEVSAKKAGTVSMKTLVAVKHAGSVRRLKKSLG